MPPDEEERRPLDKGGAQKMTTAAVDTSIARAELMPLERLADAWEPALRRSYELGHQVGWHRGWLAGRDEEREAWNRIIGVYNDTTSMPTQDELAVRRSTPRNCGCEHCSACVRRAAVQRNRARYGQDNYPGEVAS
jgi:hypothetical protein